MDEYRFTRREDELDEGGAMWSSPEEEITFRRVRDLLMFLHDRGVGLTLRPIQAGMRSGGIGFDARYATDGWEVGYTTGWGGDEIATAASLEAALQQALAAESATADFVASASRR